MDDAERQKILQLWFEKIQSAGDIAAIGILRGWSLTYDSKCMLRILFRSYAFEQAIRQLSAAEAHIDEDTFRKELYNKLIDDVLDEVILEKGSDKVPSFIRQCRKGVTEPLLVDRLMPDALENTYPMSMVHTEKVLPKIDESIKSFIKKRKDERYRKEHEDDPPEWMDEFEYIDWVHTH